MRNPPPAVDNPPAPDLRYDAGELVLPAPPAPARRSGIPVLAALAPIAGAVMIWVVTGHVLALWLAALGPVIAVASLLDSRRAARREHRRAAATSAAARRAVRERLRERHDAERRAMRQRHPDARALLDDDAEIWRRSVVRDNSLVVGRGERESGQRVTGGGDAPEDAALRADAGRLTDAPVVVPLEGGVAVSGPRMLAAAATRALALQLVLGIEPGRLRVVSGPGAEHAWAQQLPHVRDAPTVMCLLEPGDVAHPSATFVLARVDESAPPPPECTVRMTVTSPTAAIVDDGISRRDVAPEMFDPRQCAAAASILAARAARMRGDDEEAIVSLGDLLALQPAGDAGPLTARFAAAAGVVVPIDLVDDGPHAVVAGMTGSGKSELLVSWVLALCASHSTEQVVFLLADFKGGTAFDALARIPHVTGVITDLDGDGAERAIQSLRAEIRMRERALTAIGARDVADPRVRLPRLVIVVDEFAALLGEHPELHTVFTDVAARGRALGMHLVLGTQRIAGVVRDALLANCPLRVSLRVADRGDSRAVVGTEDAALLPGGRDGAGVAIVRRASDAEPQRVRIGLSDEGLLDRVCARGAETGPAPRPIWHPTLPERIDISDPRLSAGEAGRPASDLTLGLADLPAEQDQRRVGVLVADRSLLVVGRAGSGRSCAAALIAAQAPGGSVWIPADLEHGWDQLVGCAERPPAAGTAIVLDDVDTLLARLPADHAAAALSLLEAIVRDAGHGGYLVVLTARRLSGPLARVAETVSRRLVLATPGRAEHIAVGGAASGFDPSAPPGRGTLDGVLVQTAIVPPPGEPARVEPDLWRPPRGLTGVVIAPGPRARSLVSAWQAGGATVRMVDEADDVGGDGSRTVLVGDPELWQRNWRTLTRIRLEHDLLIDAACGTAYRTLTGDRDLPPPCDSRGARAWLVRGGAAPRRVCLAAQQSDRD